ncbi:hypothetical protein DIPPA_34678 [Diplonema papillatum]|nr:hypothetical protein DIPPA_34678 [Diplonema papillatum]
MRKSGAATPPRSAGLRRWWRALASKGSGTLATVRQALLQDLAEKVPARLDVEEAVLHKWDPAEVQRGYYNKAEKTTQSGCMQLSPSAWPAVLLTGDAFAPTADFEGCVDVAFRTVAHLASLADAAQSGAATPPRSAGLRRWWRALASKGSGTLATVRQALLQDLAEKVPARLDVEEAVLHKWDPAEVQRGYYNKAEKKTQSGCMQLSPSAWPAVLLTGDAFAPTADFEGCVDVAFRTVAHLASLADAAQ